MYQALLASLEQENKELDTALLASRAEIRALKKDRQIEKDRADQAAEAVDRLSDLYDDLQSRFLQLVATIKEKDLQIEKLKADLAEGVKHHD